MIIHVFLKTIPRNQIYYLFINHLLLFTYIFDLLKYEFGDVAVTTY